MNPISIPVAALKPALTGLSKIITRRSTLPVLNCVRVERTGSGNLEIAATDLDTTAVVRLETTAQGEPRVLLVPFQELSKIAKACGRDDTLLLSGFEKDKVAIRYPVAGKFVEHHCESAPADEFPDIPEVPGESIPVTAELRQAIHEALECASTDETRVILNGAYLDTSKSSAHYIVATDGRHLFSSNSFTLPLPESLLIPGHRFLNWKEFGQDGDWGLRVAKSKEHEATQFEIASGHWRFISRSCEGNYPNWRQVLPDPASSRTTVEIDPAGIEHVLRMITRMPDHDRINHVVGIEVSGGKVALLGKPAAAAEWTSIPVAEAKSKGKAVRIFLNRLFLAKALRFGLTRIDIIDELSPLRFSAGGKQMIVMPTRPEASLPPVPAPASTPAPSTETDSPEANPKERKPMPETNGHHHGAERSTPETAAEKSALEAAIAQIDSVKTRFREAIAGLNKLTDLLRQAVREQKAGDKEVQSVRQTLRSLQSVRI